MVFRLLFSFLLLISCAQSASAFITDEAQTLYQEYGDTIYQIQVINKETQKKSSIGSGFQFTKDGIIGTNFHVVSDGILKPKQYDIRFLQEDGDSGSLEILATDIAHDLALLKISRPGKKSLALGNSNLKKGEKAFSFGNPHDISFTVIEGTFNGLLEKSFYKKIHFSGSLNPGMSGGPVISHQGEVIGINVATSGNQISFLVPVEHLKDLYKKYKKDPKAQNIMIDTYRKLEQQILANQDHYIKPLLEKKWPLKKFSFLNLPDSIHSGFKCWGGPQHDEKDLYTHHTSSCSNWDRVFISDSFYTGPVVYNYDQIKSDILTPSQFSELYSEFYNKPLDIYWNVTEEHASKFSCKESFVELDKETWKSSFCMRQYKKFPKLFDTHIYLARVADPKKTEGVIVSFALMGISMDNALKLSEKILNNIKRFKG